MIAMLLRGSALIVLLPLVITSLLQRVEPPPPPLLVQADYQRCVTIKNGPLLRAPQGRLDYQIGVEFNDKGIS